MKITKEMCDRYLFTMTGSQELVDRWWSSPNKAFCGDTPDVWFQHAPRAVFNYIIKCAEGEW